MPFVEMEIPLANNDLGEKGHLASYLVMTSRWPLEVFNWTSGLPASWLPHPHPLGTIMIYILIQAQLLLRPK